MKGATDSNLGGKALTLKEKIFKDQDLERAGLYSEVFEEKEVIFIVQRNQRLSSPDSVWRHMLRRAEWQQEGQVGSPPLAPAAHGCCHRTHTAAGGSEHLNPGH